MIPLMGSEMAIIIHGMTKLLHKSGIPIDELGQCTSDHVGEPRMNTNRRELLPFFISIHWCPLRFKMDLCGNTSRVELCQICCTKGDLCPQH